MRYDDPELRDRLAAEYTLGTLEGAARRRFERLLEQDAELRARVEGWQRRLAPLADAVPPVTPPARVQQGLHARLDGGRRGGGSGGRRLPWWQMMAGIAAVLVVAIGLVTLLYSQAPPGRTYVAVLSDRAEQPAWLVQVDARRGMATVTTLTPQTPTRDRAYELWMLPPGEAPRSCGLLPARGQTSFELSARERERLRESMRLGVSVEPPKGSPTGRPTGPVRYRGELRAAG